MKLVPLVGSKKRLSSIKDLSLKQTKPSKLKTHYRCKIGLALRNGIKLWRNLEFPSRKIPRTGEMRGKQKSEGTSDDENFCQGSACCTHCLLRWGTHSLSCLQNTRQVFCNHIPKISLLGFLATFFVERRINLSGNNASYIFLMRWWLCRLPWVSNKEIFLSLV